MTLRRLHLDVYGVTATLTGHAEALDALAAHFWAYRSTSPKKPDIRIELTYGDPVLDMPKRTIADQVVDRGIVYNEDTVAWIDHYGYAVSRYDFARESGIIVAPQVADLVELGYLMLHSRLGRLLETRQGLYRLHCLGVAAAGRAALALSPSGGGKSSLALAVLRRTELRLLGDDMVLVDRSGHAHPFHFPIGVTSPDAARDWGQIRPFSRRLHPPKWLLELEGIQDRLTHEPVSVDLLLLAKRVSRPPSTIRPAPRRRIVGALWRDLVVGLGLPQVLELVARRGARDLARLVPTAARRSRAALAVARTARSAVLELADPDSAADELARELRRP